MKQKGLAGLCLAAMLVLMALVSLAAEEKVKSYAAEKNVSPYEYHPLAVGNSWTYLWENKPGNYKNDSGKKIYTKIKSLNFFMSDSQLAIVNNDYELYQPVTVRETYTITDYAVKQNKFHLYVFAISCSGEACKDHLFADGHYKYSEGNVWVWKNVVYEDKPYLTFNQGVSSRIYPNYVKSKNYPADLRSMIRFKPKGSGWDYSSESDYINMFETVEMDFSDHRVTVPAGTFEHCIEVKYIFTWEAEKYYIYYLYAPGVGKVKEYQQLEDGTITYVMSLEKYSLKK